MSKWVSFFIRTLGFILFIWAALTLWAQQDGRSQSTRYAGDGPKVLITFSPDPFYDLDQQICLAMGEAFQREGWEASVYTTKAIRQRAPEDEFDLHVFCANTYNWAPDRPTRRIVTEILDIKGKSVATLTLGGGSTARASRLLNADVAQSQAKLVDSKELWLFRPNDESRPEEDNIRLAIEKAEEWARTLAED